MSGKRLACVFTGMVLVAGVVLGANAAAVRPQVDGVPAVMEAYPEAAPGFFDPAEYAAQKAALHRWLVGERVAGALNGAVAVTVTPAEISAMSTGGCESCTEEAQRYRIGLTKATAAALDFSDVGGRPVARAAALRAHGAIRGTDDNGWVWTGAARSDGAAAVRIHFTSFSLPAGAELYVYNDAGAAFGPYTGAGPNGDGEFWSNTVGGGLAYLQVRQHGPAARGGAAPAFAIADIGHIDADLVRPVAVEMAATGFCSFNASCVRDKNCVSHPAFIDQQVADAVGHIQFVSGAYIYICSGGLVADTVAGSQIPYFLTANHCISTSKVAKTLEAYFQFWTQNCGGACYDPTGVVPRTLGSAIKATNSKTGDFTLLQLSQNPPAGSVFLGWNATAVANTNGAALYRLSHPKGAPQAYSEHAVDTSKGVCRSWPRGKWIYSRDIVGATEGGSSGSVVVNSSAQIVGQLSGGCGTNVNDVCDTARNATVDGAFAAYYSLVRPYLAP